MDNRISANVTGIDTDNIIQQLMSLERRPLVKLQSQQSMLASRKTAWGSVKTQLSALSSRLTALLSSTAFERMTATASDASVLSATASSTATPGVYDIEIISRARAQTVQSEGFAGADLEGIVSDGTLILNEQSIEVTSTDTLNTIAEKINAASDVKARASVLQTAAGEFRLVITSAETGNDGIMSFGGDTTGWKALGVVKVDDTLNEVVAAGDASFTINGISFTRSTNVVADAIPGVTLNLLGAKDPVSGAGGKTSLTIAHNDQTVVDDVKSFIIDYNNLIDTVKRYTTWDPDKKQAGTLFGDSLVNTLLSDIGQAVFTQAEGLTGDYTSLGVVGLSTGTSSGFSKDGKLSLDEAALKKALETDRNAVQALFSHETAGVFTNLAGLVEGYASTSGLVSNRQAQLIAQDGYLSRQIESMQVRLDKRMQTLRKRFTDMEIILQRLNSQSLWLSQQVQSLYRNTTGTGG